MNLNAECVENKENTIGSNLKVIVNLNGSTFFHVRNRVESQILIIIKAEGMGGWRPGEAPVNLMRYSWSFSRSAKVEAHQIGHGHCWGQR